LVEAILEAKKWPKSLPVITDKSVAREAATALIQGSFFHRSEKVEDKKGYLMVLLLVYWIFISFVLTFCELSG
jgi:hypothetical protein